MAGDGLVTSKSSHSVTETINRLAALVTEKGLTVFARIDHAAGAAAVGLELRPTELLIFGNPRVGTSLMQDRQTSGIDLPVKALAWQDANADVWLTYNSAAWLAERHALSAAVAAPLQAIEAGIALVTRAATSG